MKTYCIFAINKADPWDVRGLVNGYAWSRERVELWQPSKDSAEGRPPLREHLKHEFAIASPPKGRRRQTRLEYALRGRRHYYCAGRTDAECQWNWVVHFARRYFRKHLPEGGDFELVVCRANSKHCPAAVDFGERAAMRRNAIKYNKGDWRNARFVPRGSFDPPGSLTIWPDDGMERQAGL